MEDGTMLYRSPFWSKEDKVPEISITRFIFSRLRSILPHVGDKAWMTDTVNGTSVKFSELETLSRKVASALTKLGLKKGDVLYFVTNEMALLEIVVIAVWICNGGVRGGFPEDPEDFQAELMKDCNTRFVLCDRDTVGQVKKSISFLSNSVTLLSIGDVEEAISLDELLKDSGNECPDDVDVDPKEDVIWLPTTSGSTGLPKGAMHTHHSVLSLVYNGRFAYDIEPCLITFRNFHVAGPAMSLINLIHGVPMYTAPVFDEEKFLQAVQTYKPGIVCGFLTFVLWLSNTPLAEKYDMSSIRYVLTAGAHLSEEVISHLMSRFPNMKFVINCYGMTEVLYSTSTYTTLLWEEEKGLKDNPAALGSCVGMILPHFEFKILDSNSNRGLGTGKVGEILMRGPGVMRGYINRPEATAQTLDKEGFIHSGDLGYITEEGFVYVVGRIGENFKYKSHHITPSQVEEIVQSHPGVMEAAVVGVPEPDVVNLIRAYLVRKPGHSVTKEDVIKHVEEKAPEYLWLRGGVEFLDALPLTRAGKVSRKQLLQMATRK